MNDVIVLDTHSLIWYLMQAPSLSARAHAEIAPVFRKEREAIVPTVVLAEMETTVAKHRM